MRRHRLFAVGVSAALLLGAASGPAFAKPGNGEAKGHANKPAKPTPAPKPAKPTPAPKPAKKSKAGVSGGGAVGTAEFSIQARARRLDKSHFNYTSTDGTYKLRCRGLAYTAVSANVVTVTDTCALTTGTGTARKTEQVPVSATFTDNGQPAETQPPTAGPDRLTLTVNGATVVDNAAITGNVKVRS